MFCTLHVPTSNNSVFSSMTSVGLLTSGEELLDTGPAVGDTEGGRGGCSLIRFGDGGLHMSRLLPDPKT